MGGRAFVLHAPEWGVRKEVLTRQQFKLLVNELHNLMQHHYHDIMLISGTDTVWQPMWETVVHQDENSPQRLMLQVKQIDGHLQCMALMERRKVDKYTSARHPWAGNYHFNIDIYNDDFSCLLKKTTVCQREYVMRGPLAWLGLITAVGLFATLPHLLTLVIFLAAAATGTLTLHSCVTDEP